MTSRLKWNSGTQKEWMTSVETRSYWMVLPTGSTSSGISPDEPTVLTCPLPSGFAALASSYLNSQFHWKATTWTLTSGLSTFLRTSVSVVDVKKNRTQTMIVGRTTVNSSSGMLYWNCRGSSSGSPSAVFFLRWNVAVQKIRPHTMTPTTSAATTVQVHSVRIWSAWCVTP